MNTRHHARWLTYSTVALLGFWCIFHLPWLLPPSRRLVSDSYNLGFNNKVSILSVGFTAFALFILHLQRDERASSINRARFFRILQPSRVYQVRLTEYIVPLLYSLFHMAAIWWWYAAIPSRDFGEIDYPYSRTELTLMGYIPFRDFQWNYGPALLYLPDILVRASAGDISLDTAYATSLGITSLLGYVALYFVLTQFRTTLGQRIGLFFLLAIGFNIGLGAQYGFIRFVIPFTGIFAFHAIARKHQDMNSHTAATRIAAAVVVWCLLCFAVSPENGITFVAGLIFYAAASVRAKHTRLAWTIALALLGTGTLICVFSVDYFQSVIAFSGGSLTFPVLPTVHILFYLASLFVVVPLLAAGAWMSCHAGNTKKGQVNGVLQAALCASVLVLAGAALGRCDAPHIMTNGLGLFLISLVFFWRRFRFYPVAYLLLFTIGTNAVVYRHYRPSIAAAMEERRQGTEKPDRNWFSPGFYQRHPEYTELARQMKPLGRIGIPLRVGEDMETFVRAYGFYIPEYYPEPRSHVFSESQLAQKISGISQMPYVIVRADDLRHLETETPTTQLVKEGFLSDLLLYPLKYEIVNRPFFPEIEIGNYIRTHFSRVEELGPYVLMKKNNL